MNKPKKLPCRKRNGKQVSFDFKLSVIDEINNGRISVNYAAKKHNISRSTIQRVGGNLKQRQCYLQLSTFDRTFLRQRIEKNN